MIEKIKVIDKKKYECEDCGFMIFEYDGCTWTAIREERNGGTLCPKCCEADDSFIKHFSYSRY